MNQKILLSDFFNSQSEMNVTDYYLNLLSVNNTFSLQIQQLKDELNRVHLQNVRYCNEIERLKQKITESNVKEKLLQQLKDELNRVQLQNTLYHQEMESLNRVKNNDKDKSKNGLNQGVWIDLKNGLMWSRISIGQQWENGECLGNAKAMTRRDAKKKQTCSTFQLAGFNDWRLPTIKELKEVIQILIVRDGTKDKCIDNILFKPSKNDWGFYWSSSSENIVYLGNGYSEDFDIDDLCYVRLVRDINGGLDEL